MILWNIVDNEIEYEIEVGPITVIKGSDPISFHITRCLDDFFLNKDSKIKIFEDTQPLYKKDWECFFIPFNAHIDLEKLNSKSPLKPILDSVCHEISLTPSFLALTEIWEEIKDELDFIESKVKDYGLGISMVPFTLNDLRKYITFHPLQQFLTPIEYKQMLLKLFCNQPMNRKKLVILELPEVYASDEQFHELMNIVEEQINNGIWFMIVTNKNIKGRINYIFKGRIINSAFIDKMKNKIISDAPFFIEEEIFQEAKFAFINAVDNAGSNMQKLQLPTDLQLATTIVFWMLMRNVDISINVDLSTFPNNLAKFIKEYS